MYISKETKQQTEDRLIKVLKSSSFKVYKESYYFRELPLDNFVMDSNALAIVRDDEVWSLLVPVEKEGTENFRVFRFHFKPGLDNSGFVGWLATKIKEKFGSGLFVTCGQNSNLGGIFDYNGCPIEVADEIINYIHQLRA
ncbi:DUF6196 family protein [uncultured Winogradskyella sp.]|uniref:DUF6196 family protein n=1 Tax=uncultured Winogradskyella sp. TaxID=395353 RepID=UPI0026254C98|nr:DUF6196 family protein [uncultured Winogradskyella sp.]